MTARFQLVVRPDGRALLTTKERLDPAALQGVVDTIRAWDEGRFPVVILTDCETVQVVDVELDLAPKAASEVG